MSANNDVPVRGPEPRHDVSAIVAKFLHPDVKSGIVELIKDVLSRSRRAWFPGSSSMKVRTGKKSHVRLNTIAPNRREGRQGHEGNQETRRQNA